MRMRFPFKLVNRSEFLDDLLSFFLQNKWWWLTPIIVILIVFGLLMIFGQSSTIAPFIYTLF